MVRFFGRGKEEKEKQEEYGRQFVVARAMGKAQAQAMRQKMDSLGTAYYLQIDENFLFLIFKNAPHLYNFFSQLNSTGKIEKPRDRRRLELKLQDAILHEKMNLTDDSDFETLQYLDSLEFFGIYRILDAMGGYRGKLVTEEIERTHVQLEQPKKKGIL